MKTKIKLKDSDTGLLLITHFGKTKPGELLAISQAHQQEAGSEANTI